MAVKRAMLPLIIPNLSGIKCPGAIFQNALRERARCPRTQEVMDE